MGYCSPEQLVNYLGEKEAIRITDPNGVRPQLGLIDNAIALSDSLINSHIETQYEKSTGTPNNLVLKKISLDLAISILYENAYSKSAVPNAIVWKKIDAVKTLKEISRGELVLENFKKKTDSIISNKN
jgi:hypothetical protein